ncbi:MAG: radical SAM protein [Armatimonadetes bacterium]|nr:radical SAM protein [Armatimonadota bacterium]
MLPDHNGQIMVTYRCSAACRHCLVMAAPGQDEALVSVEAAVEYGLDFAALGRAVLIAGGEALLYSDHILRMAGALSAAGVPVAFVESNGSWCTSDGLTRRRLSLLREAGVQGMYFSVDCFHQEFAPAERVYRGISLSWELFGRENVLPSELSPARALEAEREARDPRSRRRAALSHVHFIGRAAVDLAPLAPPVSLAELLTQDCAADLDVDSLREIQVDPYGFVRPDWCPGVNLGNTATHRLVDLCRTEHVRQTPVLSEIAGRGPAALLPLAERFCITPQPAYASKCHLCFDLRRQLVEHMPLEFGPRQVYEVCRG